MRRWLAVTVVLGLLPIQACWGGEDGMSTPNVTVDVSGAGDGSGRVEDVDVARLFISCIVDAGAARGDCRDDFYDAGRGGGFELLATTGESSLFGGWTGDCVTGEVRCPLGFSQDELPIVFEVTASFLRIPDEIQVELSEGTLEPGGTATATATPTPDLPQAEYTWSSSDPAVATVTAGSPTSSATVTAVGPGTADIRASTRTRESGPVSITVQELPVDGAYQRVPWVTVTGAISIDFDSDGNVFVGNTGVSEGGAALEAPVRKVTGAGDVSDFGRPVADPDALMVDRGGEISSLGANAVLAAGAYDSQYSNNHVTEISADATTQQALVERVPPALSNPSALALLPSGHLLVGNYGNNTVARVFRDAQNALEVAPFFQDQDAPSALTSLAVLGNAVYVVTGSHRVTALDASGGVLHTDVWPQALSADPSLLSADINGSFFGSGLVAGTSDGRLLVMDPGTLAWTQIGDFIFDAAFYGLGVSPVDGVLYVIDADGHIWKVFKP